MRGVGMGVIPVRTTNSAKSPADCRLCAEARVVPTAAASAARHLRQILLPASFVCAGLVLAAIADGNAGAVGGGVAGGVAVGVLYAYSRRLNGRRAAGEAHAQELQEIAEDADNRVEAVIKQFEWAVNDLARVKARLDESEALVRTLIERAREREHQNEQLIRQISRLRERLAEIAMAASLTASGKERPQTLFEAIHFAWGLHYDGQRARLELQRRADEETPTRVRVIGRDRQIVCASGVSITAQDGVVEFQLEPPADLVADLDAGRDITYAVEALVDHDWRPVQLRDTGRRTRSVVDVEGKLARVSPGVGAPRLRSPGDGRRSALN